MKAGSTQTFKEVSRSALPTSEGAALFKNRKQNITKFVPQSSRLFSQLFS
jgi:hypothetical protein